MRRPRPCLAVMLIASLGSGLTWAAVAGATHHKYPIDAVTIKVDRGARTLSGKVVSNSTVSHFCSGGDWPVNVFMVRRGADKKVAHMKTNFDSEWRFRVRSQTLKGKRVYAEVPSFTNGGHGSCIGARSRTVRAP
ncbi:MAG TPA: hypothetical protein VKA89_09935 [Solirubrobacterales bacterium]|nr:hypothetical protein [Solirubrobacterales bacterium]